MSENIDGGSTENTDTSAADVDAQLAEMHSAESEPVETTAAEPEKAEAAPEVRKVVPLAALHEERRARQALQQQMAQSAREHQEAMQRVEQRLQMLMTPQKQLPDREQDPVGYLDTRIEALTQRQEAALQQQQAERQAQQAERQAQYQAQALDQVKSHVVAVANQFAKQTPDLGDAVNYMNTMRTRELIALGNDPSDAARLASEELDEAAIQWAVQGRNPAQTAYEFAKARGYTPKAGGAAEKIAAQQKGTAAARSLGGGGAVSAGKLTAEALANMSDADFSKLSESDWRQAMGG